MPDTAATPAVPAVPATPAPPTELPPVTPPALPTTHRGLLDAIVDGTAPQRAAVARLALPGLDSWSPGHASALIEVGPEVTFGGGFVFGGYLSCLVDLYAGFAVMTVLPDEQVFLTVQLDTSFLAPVAPGPVAIQATVAEISSRRAVVTVQLSQHGKPAVTATATQLLIRPEPPKGETVDASQSAAAVTPAATAAPAAPAGAPVFAGTYVDRILEVFAEHPEREAFVHGDRRVSYAEARRSVHRIAAALRLRGLGKGETVALFVGSRPESVLIQLAVHLAGCRLVFVAPEPAVPEQGAFLRAGRGRRARHRPGHRARRAARRPARSARGPHRRPGRAWARTCSPWLPRSPTSRSRTRRSRATSPPSSTPAAPPAGRSWSCTSTATTSR